MSPAQLALPLVVAVTHSLLTCFRDFVVEELQTDSAPGILAALKIQKNFGSRWHCEDCYRVKLDLFVRVFVPSNTMMLWALSDSLTRSSTSMTPGLLQLSGLAYQGARVFKVMRVQLGGHFTLL